MPIVHRALGAAVLALALVPGVAAAQNASPGNASQGKQLYYAHGFYGCHGYNGETGARDLVATNSPLIATEAMFTAFLRMRADVAPHLPSTHMPNYGVEALSQAQVHDLYAFIKTFTLNAPAVKDVPTLRAIRESANRPYKP